MPDISMCLNQQCPTAKDCYRYMAVASDMQSYADFGDGCGCEHFWPISPTAVIDTNKLLTAAE